MAGQTFYLAPGSYTLNDHAYILYQDPAFPYEINLKWLAIEYRDEFLSYASTSDNGTWNKTGFFTHTFIDIPSIEEQINVVKQYTLIKHKIDRIETILKRIDNIFSERNYTIDN